MNRMPPAVEMDVVGEPSGPRLRQPRRHPILKCRRKPRLLQAICRTNRPFGEVKTHGLIVDYLGVFDDVARAIQFDEEGITRVVKNIAELAGRLPEAVQKCLTFFPSVDRTVTGYEGPRLPTASDRCAESASTT